MTSDPLHVNTRSGPVQGVRSPGCLTFRGIPFAAPPVDNLRWSPPVPPEPWTDVRDALTFGVAAWQSTGGPLDGLVPGMGSDDQGDDCLNLNVWTPAADAGSRPVLVWIHGGAFSLGAGSLSVYDGSRLAAATDTVVVTFNYRLGALGFLVIDDPSTTANVGLLDQVAALAWVRDNIASFGGDPRNITIFGESAGGGSVLSLLAMPDARGLFHRAIVQSGATDLLLTREKALIVTETFAACAGVDPADVSALRALTPEQVLAAQGQAGGQLFASVGTMPFHPCLDGEILPHSWQHAADTGFTPVPLIIGTTRNEMSLFAMFDPAAADLDDAGLAQRLAAIGADAEAMTAAYRHTDTTAPPEVWGHVTTDRAMWLPALRIAEAHAQRSPTWMYRFDWPAAAPGLGAPHGVDIPFPFTNIDLGGWDTFVSDPEQAMTLAATVSRAWASFARNGTPEINGLDWPTYDSESRATIIFDREVRVELDPDGPVRKAWTGGRHQGES